MTDFQTLAETPLISRAELFGNPLRMGAKISPNGQYLSWIAPLDGVMNLWVAPRERPEAARALTDDCKRGIGSYAWSYDGRHVLYGQDQNGDENYHLYAIDLNGGAPRDLTPFPGARGMLAGQSRHPELRGRVLVSLNQRDRRFADLYVIDIASGEMTLVQENTGFGGFVCDDYFRVQLAVQPQNDGGQVYFKRWRDDWRPWLTIQADDARGTRVSHLDASGRTLYCFDSRGRDTAALVAFSLESDSASETPQVLAEHPTADIDGVLLNNSTYIPVAYSATYERMEFHVLDEGIQEDIDYIDSQVLGEWGISSRSEDDRYWIVGAGTDRKPGVAWLYDREERSFMQLYVTRPGLVGAPLARMQSTTIPSRDGLPLVSYLTLPLYADDMGAMLRSREALPLVLLVHGGPWARDGFGFNPTHQWLANRGYAVLSVNFRGSRGFGKAFIAAGDLQWGAKMDEDLLDAVDWALERGIADPARVAIMGGSYGGYATLWAMTHHPERFACGVDIVGPSNLETLMAAIPPQWESGRAMLYRAVGNPDTGAGRELLRKRSPLHYAGNIRRPLLIGQGANDPRVKQSEADQMVQAMRENGIPVTYALYPDEGHGFARAPNAVSFNAVTEWFLSHHLGGRAEGIRAEEIDGTSLQVREGGHWLKDILPTPLIA